MDSYVEEVLRSEKSVVFLNNSIGYYMMNTISQI